MSSSMMVKASTLLALGMTVQATETTATANPIRRVVTMIQNIQKKVEAEGEADEKIHKKFMCYCKNGASDLAKSIADAEAKIEETGAGIKEAEGQKAQLEQDLVTHKADRETAKTAVAEATKLREKEAATFAALKAESDANIEAIGKAVAALEKGMGGAFLQTPAAVTLRQIVNNK